VRRYLITGGKLTESQKVLFDEREKEIEAGLRSPTLQLTGEGKLISCGEFEDGSFFILAECVNPTEFLSGVIRLPTAEIRPVALCPSDCQGCPPSIVVPPLRSE